MRAGYMRIENNSDTSYRITGVKSEVFTAIDIHETIEKNGMMSMQPIMQLTIEANTAVKLKPGGIHLMMIGPKQVLKPGDRVYCQPGIRRWQHTNCANDCKKIK